MVDNQLTKLLIKLFLNYMLIYWPEKTKRINIYIIINSRFKLIIYYYLLNRK